MKTALLTIFASARLLIAQDVPKHDHAAMQGMDHSQMDHSKMAGMDHGNMDHSMTHVLNPAGMALMQQASGTASNPASWPMPMIMNSARGWQFMWMAQAFLDETQQTGPRGGDKFYSSNWAMIGAGHNVGRGSILFRSMLSLEPATITERRYPLLFQTGETAFGKPIVDGQHPHELFMELGIGYAHPLRENSMVNLYFAPVGDPALGPVAYPHRASAAEIPQATLGHHWLDSTHIANEVVTAGITHGIVRIEASGFHGGEPNENRWNIDHGAIDSWSTRLSLRPAKDWVAQVSVGRLAKPEAQHAGDVVRTTASVQHSKLLATGAAWSSTLAWSTNHKTLEKTDTHAVLAETVLPFARRNFITGRFEWSQRDELLQDSERAYNIGSYTAGYTRDVDLFRNLQTGVGANFTAYTLPSALKPIYGNHPVSVNIFLRVRLRSGA